MRRWLHKCAAVVLGASMVVTALPQSVLYAGSKDTSVQHETEQVVEVIQNASSEGKQIKNIIYMIPDGGGFPSYDIAKAVKEAGGVDYALTTQTEAKMYLDDYLVSSVKTDSLDSSGKRATDSAAAGTALATGHKTHDKYVGINGSQSPVASITEVCRLEGKATGLISTSYQYDATPAAFSAHVENRVNYNDIIKQMRYGGVNLVLGGAINYSSYTSTDNSNTIAKMGYSLVNTKNDLLNEAKKIYTDASEEVKVWSTFNASAHNMSYEYEKNQNNPTLAEMTKGAIDILSQDPDGFFVMVEGSMVDYANHHMDMKESACEWIAFDEAFKVALDFASQRDDTAIVVAPDHNTGVEYVRDGKMDTIVQMVKQQQSTKGNTDLMEFGPMQSNGESDHTRQDVGVWMYVPEGVGKIPGVSDRYLSSGERNAYTIENTAIAPYLATLVTDYTMASATNELFRDVTDKGYCKDNKFYFNDFECNIELNTDIAYIDNSAVDLKGRVAVNVGGRTYVPRLLLQKLGLEAEDVEVMETQPFNGEGTKENPYTIANAEQFVTFTNALRKGEHYNGKYFKQTANLDMATELSSEIKAKYKGISSTTVGTGDTKKDNVYFAGTYDGQGHTINVEIETSSEESVSIFPYTCGTILNLGTTGSIINKDKEGACAGIALALRNHTNNNYSGESAGKLINCWSIVALDAKKDAAGITVEVENGAALYNGYYKGKITAANNYGVAKSNGTVKNGYYKMEDGSSSISNDAAGENREDFAADQLTAQQNEIVAEAGLESADQLCDFETIDGCTFAFAGSVARLTELSYSYATETVERKTVVLEEFDPTNISYYVQFPENSMNPNRYIEIFGKVSNEETETATGHKFWLDNKGQATGTVVVKKTVKTDYYETTTEVRYSIRFTGNKCTEQEEEPVITEEPTQAPTQVPTQAPTQVPTQAPTPTPTQVPPTQAPTATPTQVPTQAPTQVPTQAPTATPIPTATPVVTPKVNVVTVTAVAATPEPAQVSIKDCDITLEYTTTAYNRKAKTPAVIVSYKGAVLKENTDYTLEYTQNVNAGSAYVNVVGKGSYVGNVMKEFKITAKKVSKLKITKKVTGKNVTVTIKYGNYKLKKNKDYKVSLKTMNKKRIRVTVSGKGNYASKKVFYIRMK